MAIVFKQQFGKFRSRLAAKVNKYAEYSRQRRGDQQILVAKGEFKRRIDQLTDLIEKIRATEENWSRTIFALDSEES